MQNPIIEGTINIINIIKIMPTELLATLSSTTLTVKTYHQPTYIILITISNRYMSEYFWLIPFKNHGQFFLFGAPFFNSFILISVPFFQVPPYTFPLNWKIPSPSSCPFLNSPSYSYFPFQLKFPYPDLSPLTKSPSYFEELVRSSMVFFAMICFPFPYK